MGKRKRIGRMFSPPILDRILPFPSSSFLLRLRRAKLFCFSPFLPRGRCGWWLFPRYFFLHPIYVYNNTFCALFCARARAFPPRRRHPPSTLDMTCARWRKSALDMGMRKEEEEDHPKRFVRAWRRRRRRRRRKEKKKSVGREIRPSFFPPPMFAGMCT